MGTLNQIFCGNNVEVLERMEDETIDLIVTSPPYDAIRDYNGYKLDFFELGKQCLRVLKDGGVMAVVINDGTKDFAKSMTSFRFAVNMVDNVGFKLFETIIYKRDGRPGAWWASRFRVDHEYIFIFFKGNRPKYFNKSHLAVPTKTEGSVWAGAQRKTSGEMIKTGNIVTTGKTKCRGTVWEYNPSAREGNRVKLLHPATFPDKLAHDLILTFSQEGDTILDVFNGSGTTMVMAAKNNRNSIGIDISQEYCDIAAKRLESELNENLGK